MQDETNKFNTDLFKTRLQLVSMLVSNNDQLREEVFKSVKEFNSKLNETSSTESLIDILFCENLLPQILQSETRKEKLNRLLSVRTNDANALIQMIQVNYKIIM